SQRRGYAVLGEDGWIDPSREIAQVLEGLIDEGPDVGERRRSLRRVLLGRGSCHPKLHGQCDEVLLGSVVDVTLDPAAFGVLGFDDALAGCSKLGGGALDLLEPG